MKQVYALIFVLSLLAIVAGYNYWFQPFAHLMDSQSEIAASPSPTPDLTTFEGRWSQLSPREKVAQLVAAPLVISSAAEKPATESAITKEKWSVRFGLVTVFGTDVSASGLEKALGELRSQVSNSAVPAPIIAVDHEGGLVQRLSGDGFTRLPAWAEMCRMSREVAAQRLDQSAQELKASGVEMIFAPVVDVSTSTAFQASRMCSGTPAVVAERALDAVNIYRKSKIAPVIKHFPGTGQEKTDLHTTFSTIAVSSSEVDVYRQVLVQFPTIGAMTTHIGVQNQVPDLPCSISQWCVGELIKIAPEALIVSDAIEMKSAQGPLPQATVSGQVAPVPRSLATIAQEAFLAGNHVVLLGPTVSPEQLKSMLDELEAKYTSNSAFAGVVDQRAKFFWKWRQSWYGR